MNAETMKAFLVKFRDPQAESVRPSQNAWPVTDSQSLSIISAMLPANG